MGEFQILDWAELYAKCPCPTPVGMVFEMHLSKSPHGGRSGRMAARRLVWEIYDLPITRTTVETDCEIVTTIGNSHTKQQSCWNLKRNEKKWKFLNHHFLSCFSFFLPSFFFLHSFFLSLLLFSLLIFFRDNFARKMVKKWRTEIRKPEKNWNLRTRQIAKRKKEKKEQRRYSFGCVISSINFEEKKKLKQQQ